MKHHYCCCHNTSLTRILQVGFSNRPVYGAMWAPMLVVEAEKLTLGTRGNPTDASLLRARSIFYTAWSQQRDI